MGLLDNWLVQALIGSFIYSVLSKVTLDLYKSFKLKNANSNYFKKTVRTNFYLSLTNIIIGYIAFIFDKVSVTKANGLIVIFAVAWSFILLVFSFEDAINHSINKRINNRNKKKT
ncbi:MAG: hypothetical protein ACI4VH_06970 [Clostridia bacterium]